MALVLRIIKSRATMKLIYWMHVKYICFIRSIYRKRNYENTINALVLGFLLIALNIHSFLVLAELFARINFGLLDFWKPGGAPKVGWGYLVGFLFILSYLLVAQVFKSAISRKERNLIMRKAVQSKSSRKYTPVLYITFSVLLFFLTLALMIVRIIPKGGI